MPKKFEEEEVAQPDAEPTTAAADENQDPGAMFEGLKKKKKKKKVVNFAEATEDDVQSPLAEEPVKEQEAPATPPPSTPATADAAEDEDTTALFADMKKKKKKKAVSLDALEPAAEVAVDDAPSSVAAATADVVDTSMFGEKRKKKKKGNMADFEKQLNEDGGFGSVPGAEDGEVDESKVKDVDSEQIAKDADAWLKTDRDYNYDELLTRVFKIIRQNNPELVGEKKRYTIVPPQVLREGSRKTVFANVVDIAKRMHRTPEHLISFLHAELGTTGSIDGGQRLVIKGRFQQKQIENVLKRYIVEYVTCKTCKSADTILTKENRLFFVQCESCGSTRTVSAIKVGFQAQTERRAAQRAAAGN